MVTEMERIILLSGGIDSALLACRYAGEPETLCLFIHYGQPAAKEERVAAMRIATACDLPVQVITAGIGCSEMRTGSGTSGPREVPGRNLAMLALTATYYPNSELIIGCTYNDSTDYPDCRTEFIWAVNEVLSVCTEARVSAPLIRMSKREIIEEAVAEGWSSIMNLTWSCYQGQGGIPCGSCNSCIEAEQAYANSISV